MALLFQELKDGIQLGKDQDVCVGCAKEAAKHRQTVQEGLLTNKEAFILNVRGLRLCYCMPCFSKLLGNYTLVEDIETILNADEVLELDEEAINAIESAKDMTEVDNIINEKLEEKENAKATKTAKSSKRK